MRDFHRLGDGLGRRNVEKMTRPSSRYDTCLVVGED